MYVFLFRGRLITIFAYWLPDVSLIFCLSFFWFFVLLMFRTHYNTCFLYTALLIYLFVLFVFFFIYFAKWVVFFSLLFSSLFRKELLIFLTIFWNIFFITYHFLFFPFAYWDTTHNDFLVECTRPSRKPTITVRRPSSARH